MKVESFQKIKKNAPVKGLPITGDNILGNQ